MKRNNAKLTPYEPLLDVNTASNSEHYTYNNNNLVFDSDWTNICTCNDSKLYDMIINIQ